MRPAEARRRLSVGAPSSSGRTGGRRAPAARARTFVEELWPCDRWLGRTKGPGLGRTARDRPVATPGRGERGCEPALAELALSEGSRRPVTALETGFSVGTRREGTFFADRSSGWTRREGTSFEPERSEVARRVGTCFERLFAEPTRRGGTFLEPAPSGVAFGASGPGARLRGGVRSPVPPRELVKKLVPPSTTSRPQKRK